MKGLSHLIHLRLGDSKEVLKDFEDNTFSSVVTDPPYELGFMEKAWDSTGIAYDMDLWKEVLRVLKPGGFLLAFSGTRTYHRMACAIEDAGFQIRSSIYWLFASGMPKSVDISKAIDRRFGAEREVVGQREDILKKQRKDLETGHRKILDSLNAGNSERNNGFKNVSADITVPATEEAKKWDGWGGDLKPACEPICMSRKPLSEKTLIDNVMKWGCGGLNIDASRIPLPGMEGNLEGKRGTELGRYPSNVLFDEEAAKMLDEQTGILKSGTNCVRRKEGRFLEHKGEEAGKVQITYGDSGGASRFFYCNKASKKERGEGNDHTTVKPVRLMEYLVRMVTPPGGLVLDPFMGSGSTGIACKNLGFGFIGIEQDAHYMDIARRRIGVED